MRLRSPSALALVLLSGSSSLGLVACGSSSSSSTTGVDATSGSPTGTGGATASSSAVTGTGGSIAGTGGFGGSGTGTGGAGGSGGSVAGTGGSGGGTGGTGTGGGTPCSSLSDCPGADTDCQKRTCDSGVCGVSNVTMGTAVSQQTPGDCLEVRCDGTGGVDSFVDDTDLPDDKNPCTIDACKSGTPSHTNAAANTKCGTNLVCDGNGMCVGCTDASQCPAAPNECQTAACHSGTCGTDNVAAPGNVTSQKAGDCQKNQCDGMGHVIPAADDTDLPVDNKTCTKDLCNGGVPTNPPVAAGTACTDGGGKKCDANGNCVQCLAPADCGTDSACQTFACVGGMCMTNNLAKGTVVAGGSNGDCHSDQCDGAGKVTSNAIDTNDKPIDGKQCTQDLCSAAGAPSNPPVTTGTACTDGGGKKCDATGTCVQCLIAADCGVDTTCQKMTCNAGVCGVMNTAKGTVVTNTLVGDCHTDQCDGNGGVTANAVDDTDVPNDGNACTTDTCSNGTPGHSNQPIHTVCGAGLECDDMGHCQGCVTDADCSAAGDTECQTHTCLAGGTCGYKYAAAGTVLVNGQTPGDCHTKQCGAMGAIVDMIDDTDKPGAGTTCTTGSCTAGVPGQTNATAGTACSDGGGVSCDGSGVCSQPFTVLQMGSANTATAVSLVKFYANGMAAGATVNLPTAISGVNQPLTLPGNGTSEGALARSANGKYLALAGYAAAVGDTIAATTDRVVARIDASDNVDTTTRATSTTVTSSNIRGAIATDDGTHFWISGNGSTATGGVSYFPIGAASGVHVLATPANMRAINIFNGQLYGSAGSTPFTNIFTVGTGLPTTTGQMATALAGFPTAANSASPYAFFFVAANPAAGGNDTFYVADDSGTAKNGGIQRWVLHGATWTNDFTFTSGITTGARGVTGWLSGTTVNLIVVTAEGSPNKIWSLADTGAESPLPVFKLVATAPAGANFRGVALSAH